MTVPSKNPSHKVISLLIKAAILIFSLWYIWQRLARNDSFANLGNTLEKADLELLVLTFFLMFINWGIEAYKWKLLIAPLENISFSMAFKSIFAGVTVSIFMPNRIGEFAGRIFYLEQADKVKATLKNFVGSAMQLSVTLIVGLVAFFSFSHTGFSDEPTPDMFRGKSFGLVIIFFALLSITFVVLYLLRAKLNSRFKEYLSTLFETPRKDFIRAYLLSAIRYFVFLMQYFLVLKALHVQMDPVTGCMLIAVTFLITSIIPTFALTEIVTRGATAAFFFSTIQADAAVIVAGSLLVWIINLAIPALFGTAFIWKLKLFKS